MINGFALRNSSQGRRIIPCLGREVDEVLTITISQNVELPKYLLLQGFSAIQYNMYNTNPQCRKLIISNEVFNLET